VVARTIPIFPLPQSSGDHLAIEEASQAPRPRIVTPLGEDDQPHRLLDLQTKLVGLTRSFRAGQERQSRVPTLSNQNTPFFSTGSGLSEDVEEIYRATETFVGITKTMWQLEEVEKNIGSDLGAFTPSLSLMPGDGLYSSSVQPHGATVLLLSSCYFSLIHVYELLIKMLRERLQEQSQQPTIDVPNNSTTSNRSSSNYTPQGDVPMISIWASAASIATEVRD